MKKYWSTMKKLIILAGRNGTATAQSGNTEDSDVIAHFETNASKQIKNLIINLPYRHGGYDMVSVNHAGVNLLRCDTFTNGTGSGVTYAGTRNANNEIDHIHVSGKATAGSCFRNVNYAANTLKWPPDGAYATYGYSTEAIIAFACDGSPNPLDRDGIAFAGVTGHWKVYDLEHKSEARAEWVRVQLMPNPCSEKTFDANISPLICLAQDKECEYEPYKGLTYTAELPNGFYGGMVDLITGKAEKTYAENGTQLQEPVQVSVTPQSISAFQGINNIWSNDGTVTVKYRTH